MNFVCFKRQAKKYVVAWSHPVGRSQLASLNEAKAYVEEVVTSFDRIRHLEDREDEVVSSILIYSNLFQIFPLSGVHAAVEAGHPSGPCLQSWLGVGRAGPCLRLT